MENIKELELSKAYNERSGMLKEFGEFVKKEICNALDQKYFLENASDKLLQIPPLVRVKETDSFIEKALYRKKNYNDPLLDITDQVGVRFVTLLLEYVRNIGKIIENMVEFKCEKCRDFEQEKLNNPDHFTYQSDHYVIRLKNKININGNIVDDSVSCEVQIRTILQHAYAEMSHMSDYKPAIPLEEDKSKNIKRLLAKGSALVEITDDAFGEIQKMLIDCYNHIDDLLQESAKIYKSFIGEEANNNTKLGIKIADAYRDLLKDVNKEKLQYWLENNRFFIEVIKNKRKESLLYKDSIIIILGWLAFHYQIKVPKLWPEDSAYLEDFYTTIGISTQGLAF